MFFQYFGRHGLPGADTGFFKEGVVSLRVESKRPRAKGMGKGGQG